MISTLCRFNATTAWKAAVLDGILLGRFYRARKLRACDQHRYRAESFFYHFILEGI